MAHIGSPTDEDDPVKSVLKELTALKQQTSSGSGRNEVRIKFEYLGERRMAYFQRPLHLSELHAAVKRFFDRPLTIVFGAGSNNEIQLPVQTQNDVDQMIEFHDRSPGAKNIKIFLKDSPSTGFQQWSPKNSKKLPSPAKKMQSPTQPSQGRYSPPPGTIDEGEVKGHRGSITSLNSEGEFIPDKAAMIYSPPAIHTGSSSTSLDSSISSPLLASDNQWYDRYGRVLSYPEEISSMQDNPYLHSSGGTYPKRLHAKPDDGYERKPDISRSFPRIRPTSSRQYLGSNAYFTKKSPINM